MSIYNIYKYADKDSSAFASHGIRGKQNRSDFSDIKTDFSSIEYFIEAENLKEKPFVQNFFNMIEFSGTTVDSVTPMNFTDPQKNQFAINMLKAFEEFDNLGHKGLITQQFTALAQKCADKGVRILIGEDQKLSPIRGICINDACLMDNSYAFINISEDLVKKAMRNPIYVIQQEGNNTSEIKAIPLGELVAGQENVNFDDSALICKCAAYLLFHELFHVNTFVEYSQWESSDQANANRRDIESVSNHNIMGFSSEHIKLLLNGLGRGDDFRNVAGVTKYREERVPGEYELLQALYPSKKIMRLYEGKFLDFSKDNVLNAAVNVAKAKGFSEYENDNGGKSKLESKGNTLDSFFEENLKKADDLLKKLKSSDKTTYIKFDTQKSNIKKLKDRFNESKKNNLPVIVDSSIWKAQADQYIQAITKKLEEIQREEDMKNGTYIPS